MTANERQLMLSIKPRFVEAILAGHKTVELRRTQPQLNGLPTEALLYASSPTMALAGTCWVESVVALPVAQLWKRYGRAACVTRSEFDAYFDGVDVGYGLLITDPSPLERPVTLAQLRHRWDGFQPPQSFRYIPTRRTRALLAAS